MTLAPRGTVTVLPKSAWVIVMTAPADGVSGLVDLPGAGVGVGGEADGAADDD